MSPAHPHRRVSVSSFVLCTLVLGGAAALRADPVQHLVLFQFKPGTTPAELRQVYDGFDTLIAGTPGCIGFQWGRNNSPEGLAKGFTHGFVITFESLEARDKYMGARNHDEFREIVLPRLADVFALDFSVPKVPEPAEPGRVHHLVFFKFKPDAPKEKIDEVNAAFAQLPRRIAGLLSFQAGPNNLDGDRNKGFSHGYLLTFVNDRARDDYIVHPAHKEFVNLVGPVLAEPLVVDFTVTPSGCGLFVVDGLEPYRVYQRDESGTADIPFSGVTRTDGPVEARLRAGRRAAPAFDWNAVGKAEGGTFTAELKDVPVGGEYTVEVRIKDALGQIGDHTEVANILVGDIWILAGQSNMEGVGDLIDVEPPSPGVHCFTMAHRWELAVEPLHWLIDSPDPVHSGPALDSKDEDGRRQVRAAARASRKKGTGLGLPFARELFRRTGVPIGLIAAAHGGTSMAQWDPAKKDLGAASLYGSMLKQVKNAGGKVKGALWYQGESDANPEAVLRFAERFKGLVAAFRNDLGAPQLPFYYVQIGRFVRDGDGKAWNQIQELQRVLETDIPGSAVVPVIDLTLDDLIHVGTQGLKRAGARLAKVADRELFGSRVERGPRLAGIELRDDRRTIRVKYVQINGRLQPSEKVEGFSLRRPDGGEIKLIYNAGVDPADGSAVILKLQNPAPEDASLEYGAGLDPLCNLTDLEDMAAPVFGPLPLEG